jgi:hypothetical protein
MTQKERIIAQTKKWIVEVVVGLNFCPFAAREVKKESIFFKIIEGNNRLVLQELVDAFERMKTEPQVETMFLLLTKNFDRFPAFLKLIGSVNTVIRKEGYEGIYQVATFHPAYQFAGSGINDAANYTNRSPYPMLQILREESVSRAVDTYPDTHKIAGRNIAFARQKGLAYMQSLRAACMNLE